MRTVGSCGAGELIAPDDIVDWPVTGERIVGRDNFIAVQREYPEGWTINVKRIVGQGDQVVGEVDVPQAAPASRGRPSRCRRRGIV